MKTSNSKRQFFEAGAAFRWDFWNVRMTNRQLEMKTARPIVMIPIIIHPAVTLLMMMLLTLQQSQLRGTFRLGWILGNGKRGKAELMRLAVNWIPGICLLPGPNAKKDWPPKDKYQGAEKIPGMCQACSTVCGIIGYVKDGRVLKVEGNPNDPNMPRFTVVCSWPSFL